MTEGQNASHSAEVEEQQQVDVNDEQSVKAYYAAFGIQLPAEDQDDEGDDDQDDNNDLDEDQKADPAIDRRSEESKGVTVKHNGQDVTVNEDEVPEYLQMGLNYGKIKGRAQQYEQALDRLARQQGYKDHADLLANLDKIEQQQVQRQRDHFDQLKQHLRQEAEEAGLNPDVLDQYLDNHPILQQARAVLQRDEHEQQTRQQEAAQQEATRGWEALFAKYPSLAATVNPDGSGADWLTPDMQAKLQRGYDPIDAYELVHRDSLAAQTRKQAEQAALKQQRLNKRSQVTGAAAADSEPEVPQELKEAFGMFGLDPKSAKKYAKNYKR
ncbi:hypothetical protein [Paenibacillus zanthoxyli]|uniref:hypothetical protein n=1 Tax=Paenibacillus zanthoxyli TaxID=369399 RepID=UPI00047011E6|nr:hypothetical protein [Paenibacillus zanthoxyli]